MEKRVEYSGPSGVQCDAPGCGYFEQVSDDDIEQYINKPCPKCGANLLTQEDFDNAAAMTQALREINEMSKEEIEALAEDFAKKYPELHKKLKDLEDEIGPDAKVSGTLHAIDGGVKMEITGIEEE